MKHKIVLLACVIGAGLVAVGVWIAAMSSITGSELFTFKPSPDSFGHSAPVNALAFSPDSQLLASGSDDGTAKLWDLETKRERLILRGQRAGRVRENAGTSTGVPVRVLAVAFAPNGKALASGATNETVKLWTTSSGEELSEFKVVAAKKYGSAWVTSLAFSPENSMLAAGVNNLTGEGNDSRCSVIIWKVASGNEVRTLSGSMTSYPRLAFIADGTVLALANGQKVTLFEVSSGDEKLSLETQPRGRVISMTTSKDGKLLAYGEGRNDPRGKDLPCNVVVWDLLTRKQLVAMKGHTKYVSSVSFGPDGKLLASGSWDGTVRLWEISTGKELVVLNEHDGPVYAVTISPDGKTLASGGKDGIIRIWEVADLLMKNPTK